MHFGRCESSGSSFLGKLNQFHMCPTGSRKWRQTHRKFVKYNSWISRESILCYNMLYTTVCYIGKVYWAIVCYNKTGYLEKVDIENNIINLIPRSPINMDFNAHNYRADCRKHSIIFGTFYLLFFTCARYKNTTKSLPCDEVGNQRV